MLRLKWQCVVFNIYVASLVMLMGCGGGAEGPATEPVSGTVTLDGKPIEGAQVVFVPNGSGRAASATTDAAGKYELTTFNPADGAVIGSYKVTIAKTEGATVSVNLEGLSPEEATKKAAEAYYSSGANKNIGNPNAKAKVTELVPAKYKSDATSGLTAEVKEGNNTFDFPLTSGA
jgi:hypothetical protein